MKVEEIQISNFQLQQLFEEFNAKLKVDGINQKYSWFLYKNCEAMANLYNVLMSELYDERREADYPNMIAENQEIIEKYADRDADKNIIYNQQGNVSLTTNLDKYNKAAAELREKYKTLFEKIAKKDEINREIYLKQVSFMATMLELSEFPINTKPYIIGILGY